MKESVRKQIHMGGFSPEKTMNSVRGLRTLYGKSYVEVVKKSCVEPQSMESNVFGSDSSHVNDAKDNMDMVREDQNPINLDWISKRLGIGKGVLGASKHDRSFQLHEKNDNSIHDHFNSRCSIGSMEGSKEAQKFLANQISFRKMSIGNKENHLHLASKKDIGSGSSGLGPNGKPPKVCPQPKRVHFKENGLSSVLNPMSRNELGGNIVIDLSEVGNPAVRPHAAINVSSNIDSSEVNLSSSDISVSHVFETELVDYDRIGI
ncbi:hypothetical protein QYF36_000556 [Acer negundo]|nr:hypothetical protein QYF36_000556 [Acer negundo]